MTVAAKGFWLRQGHAELLRSSGFHVLAFDFNGFGESDSIDFDYPGDVLAAGEYLKRRIAPLPIGVLGCSFGAGYALCAMAEEGHPFRAAILEAAFPSLPFYWRRYPLPHLLLRASQLVYPRFERRLRPIRAASELKGLPRILLVQGTRDSITPVTVGEELRNAMTGHESVALWIAEEAEHNHALRAQPAGYAERVIPFLRNAFDVASRTPPAPRTAAYNHQRSS
jgi:pimeloyl-ACP methyl ester carboxylesterase